MLVTIWLLLVHGKQEYLGVGPVCDMGLPRFQQVCLPEKPATPNNIGEGLKGTQRQFRKEALFVQYDKKKYQPYFVSHPNKILP